jgi:hypothetical protein
MEPVEAEMKLSRQPLPVTVRFEGEQMDIDYWMILLSKRAEFRGDQVQIFQDNSFKIYPRAVND